MSPCWGHDPSWCSLGKMTPLAVSRWLGGDPFVGEVTSLHFPCWSSLTGLVMPHLGVPLLEVTLLAGGWCHWCSSVDVPTLET